MCKLTKFWGKPPKSSCLTYFQVALCRSNAGRIFGLFIEGMNTKKNRTGNISYKNDTNLKKFFKIACQTYFLKAYVFSSVAFLFYLTLVLEIRKRKKKREHLNQLCKEAER